MFRLFECCALSFFERFVLSFSLKIERFVSDSAEIWICGLYLEHATCYSDDNYWCALTDGKIKYIWRIHTGTEELFDLTQDPQELHNAVNDKKYRKQLTEMRNEMIRHLSERGEEFVKDGRLVVKEKTMLYGPHYPEKENKR